MKKIIILLTALLANNVYAHDDGGFYVIPVPVEVEVIKNVCVGTPVGSRVFELNVSLERNRVRTGQTYSTTAGRLVEITGYSNCNEKDCGIQSYSVYLKGSSFYVAPAALSPPTRGVKGTFYNLESGGISFAKYL